MPSTVQPQSTLIGVLARQPRPRSIAAAVGHCTPIEFQSKNSASAGVSKGNAANRVPCSKGSNGGASGPIVQPVESIDKKPQRNIHSVNRRQSRRVYQPGGHIQKWMHWLHFAIAAPALPTCATPACQRVK